MPSQRAPITNYTLKPLQPLYDGLYAKVLPVNLSPSTSYAAGQVLTWVANSANDVQTLTLSGTPTGGNFTLFGYNPLTSLSFTTAAIAYNATAATIQAELQKQANFGAGNATVAGSAGGPWTVTFAGTLAGVPVPVLALATNGLTGGTSPTLGVVHTTTGRTAGTYAKYTSSGAACILKTACQTDASGEISFSTTNSTGRWNETTLSTEAYFSGIFNTAELVGLDSGAVGNLGRLWYGTVTAGALRVY